MAPWNSSRNGEVNLGLTGPQLFEGDLHVEFPGLTRADADRARTSAGEFVGCGGGSIVESKWVRAA